MIIFVIIITVLPVATVVKMATIIIIIILTLIIQTHIVNDPDSSVLGFSRSPWGLRHSLSLRNPKP